MSRKAELERKTKETQVRIKLDLDGNGGYEIDTGIGFFDHMLTLAAVHGAMDLMVTAVGDIHVDYHHTIEDVGLVLGEAISGALGDRKGIRRYGHAVIPMDDALADVAVDLSNRPFTVFQCPATMPVQHDFDASLAREFFRAMAQRAGMNLHVRILYGENWHHMIESAFKALGRALRQAVSLDKRTAGIPSSKGSLT